MAPPPIAYLEDVASKYPALAGTCQTLRDLYERKLWHELSLEVASVFAMPEFVNSGLLADTYMNFVSDFGHKINLLYLAKFAQAVAKQYQDVGVATSFLESQIAGLEELKRPQTVEPILYLKMQIAELKVYSQDEAGCKELFEAGLAQIESMQDVDPSVSAAVHSVRALYYKAKQDFSSYYRAALTYLCYVSLDTLTPDVKLNLAVDISFAALLGDGVYSFAELLLHPIVKVLDGSPYAWLAELLNCFSSGDMVLYEQLCAKHAAAMNAQPALVAAERQLREKITIMCLVALLHSLPTDARRVSLATIAARTRLDIDGTEFLLMKAFSLQLVRGSIDEIDGFVDITWVAPRVLTLPEIAGIQSHLQNWVAKVDAATGLLESEGVSTVEALA